MNEDMSDLPQAENADPDGVQLALRAAQTLWSRGDTTESLKWLRKAAESASDEGADVRSLQLAKAAAELRAKLFGSSEAPRSARPDSEPPRSAPPPSPPVEAFPSGGASEDGPASGPSRPPVTATQYPSHRPRQRIGLLSPSPSGVAQRESTAYESVPLSSADAERRISSAPPPLPRPAADDYDELEAEPDEESFHDDPGSVWSSAGPESWRPSELDSNAFGSTVLGTPTPPRGATPPPLPPRAAFAEDEAQYSEPSDPPTVVIPPLDESEEDRAREARRVSTTFAVQGSAWDQQARSPGWDQHPGSSWATELHASTWGNGASEPTSAESALQSEAARARLTARVHHQAVRVSFAPDLRVPGQYVVRPLREGEKAAAGERVALLVALEPGVPLV
jgi:hypothetical protein